MTEFAIVAPILFALVFGIFDFGRGMSANVTVTNSTREAARYAATETTTWLTPGRVAVASPGEGRFNNSCPGAGATAPNSDSPQGKAWKQMQAANLDLTTVGIVVRYYASNNDPISGGAANDTFTCNSSTGAITESNGGYTPQSGDWVQVEITYTYTPVTPFIGAIVHNAIKLDQTATMVLE